MKGLIIDEPWISKILSGEKDWEMRSRATNVRGLVALIRKGSGAVVGVATVTGSHGPLSLQELRQGFHHHHVPMAEFESGRASKWRVAWKLTGANALTTPVRYQHPFGAVVWVTLDAGVQAQIRAQLDGMGVHVIEPSPQGALGTHFEVVAFNLEPSRRLPVANDGTWFGPHLLRAGQFTVGEKGSELRLDSFDAALSALADMPTPRWRRPNAKGNWGIVSATRWATVRELTAGRE